MFESFEEIKSRFSFGNSNSKAVSGPVLHGDDRGLQLFIPKLLHNASVTKAAHFRVLWFGKLLQDDLNSSDSKDVSLIF